MSKSKFSKVIRPGTIKVDSVRRVPIFCKIEIRENGELSITGVEGPRTNGDCFGSCGQIEMHLSEPGGLDTFEPAEGWTLERFQEFLKVWDKWHLNHMKPYDEEMEAAGWPELARKEMRGYAFSLTTEAYEAKKAAERAALEALRNDQTFKPHPDQVMAATRPGSYEVWTYADEPEPAPVAGYERTKDLWGHNKGNMKHPERKTLGWLRPQDHPDGLLTRKLREDGQGYGSAWFKRELPLVIVQFLADLPASDQKPAWV